MIEVRKNILVKIISAHYKRAVSRLQTCVSRASWMDCVSTHTSKAYSALMLSVIESLVKRVEKFHNNMLRQYSAHTESFGDCPER